MNERIAIIGGGIGGLCLAQGLRQAGARVTVYERDRTPADRLQGYRVHIDPNGAEALRTCLPPHLWQAFLDTTGTGGQDFAFVTEQMKLLALIETPPDAGHYSVSRITLRQVLLSGLDDVVRFGKRFERLSDGRYELHFADGTRERADIVVGADGGGSRVRQQYLPHAKRVDTGITTVAGKHLLTPAARVRLPETLTGRLNTVIPPAGMGMFVAPHELEGVAARDGIGVTEQEGALMDNSTSYVMWAIGAARNRFPSDISEMSGVQLRDAVSRMIEAWHPDLRELVAGSHPDTVSLLPIRTSIPIDPWQPSRVTLLGDAIHSMTPMRGIGANVALRDARLLTEALTSGRDPVAAIGAYEERMREYGFTAVRDSMRAAEQFAGGGRAARLGFKSFLRVVQHVPALKAKMLT